MIFVSGFVVMVLGMLMASTSPTRYSTRPGKQETLGTQLFLGGLAACVGSILFAAWKNLP
jgi:hypothetical protein